MARPSYRKENGSNLWHFCLNCSRWPTADWEAALARPTSGEFCDECIANDRAGMCA